MVTPHSMEATCKMPEHGRVECSICHYPEPYNFDRTRTEREGWRITNNPLAWGGREPEVIVLGFSKGPTQAGALASIPHDAIAFKGGRANVAKILHHIELLERPDARLVDQLINDKAGRFHFGSLIRCTVERWDAVKESWSGTGGGMLDKFVATEFGASVAQCCISTFLGHLPEQTRLIVMLGLGSKLNYVRVCKSLFEQARPGSWDWINSVAYSDGKIVIVHTEHFVSQGALIPNWLSGKAHERGRLGLLARDAASRSGVMQYPQPAHESIQSERTAATETSLETSKSSPASPLASGATVRPHSPVGQVGVGHPLTLTDGAIRNANLSLNGARYLIPAGGVGGTNKAERGRVFTVRFEPGEAVETDIAGDKMTLRCRGAVRAFFKKVGASKGDIVLVNSEGPRTLVVTIQRR